VELVTWWTWFHLHVIDDTGTFGMNVVRGFALHTTCWFMGFRSHAFLYKLSCNYEVPIYVICSLVLWLMRMISVQNLFMWNICMLSVIRLVIDLILPIKKKKTMLITKLVSLYFVINNKKNYCERREKEGKALFKHL
jgi:hypothetical protein